MVRKVLMISEAESSAFCSSFCMVVPQVGQPIAPEGLAFPAYA